MSFVVRPNVRPRWLRAVAATALATVAVIAASGNGATWQDEVDYTLLKSRLGANLPIGDGGVISQVEAENSAGTYQVNVAGNEFTATFDPHDPGVAVNLVVKSGGQGDPPSGHATSTVAYQFYGNTASMAPGANNIDLYEANDWLSSVLNYNSTIAPLPQWYRVQNHSWVSIAGIGSDAQDQAALRRFDYLIETGDMTAVVGTNNYNPDKPNSLKHPKLLVHSYNAIVVGRSDGYHSRGMTTSLYGGGRYRPDIVVPRPSDAESPAPSTSRSTATVSSAATLLADVGEGTDAARTETIRALLLAGATKREFAGFIDPATGLENSWARTPTQPLDDLFGAGELNIYNSYLSHLGGQYPGAEGPPADSVGSYGWDYQNFKSYPTVGDMVYNFTIPVGSTADELSIVLAWNAKITDTPAAGFTPLESLQNLDLRLYDSTTTFLGTEIDSSISTDYNVEHVYQEGLGPGTYSLVVSGAAGWDYGLAWRMATLFDEPSADFNEDGYVDGNDLMAWQRHVGMLINATHADGDADGDGDVDEFDLDAWKQGLMPAPPLAQVAAVGVPEPATISLVALAGGFMAAAAGRSRRRR
jgi:hypothetical protein